MTSNLSCLSSLKDDDAPLYIQPHYKESYRLAIYALLCGGKEAYEEFLCAEQISHFLSEEEILFILENGELAPAEDESEGREVTAEVNPSTYFPMESDDEVPDLDLGWPEVTLEDSDTSISLLFQPPRENTPSIKDVVRKQIQEARQLIAIAMDVFTDVDIFKEVVSATLRGVVVYILLDDTQFQSFLTMSHRVGVNIQDLKNIRVRTVQGPQYQCQSGVKFNGGMEQKFILVDCRTVLYGTYSYTWSFEKINLSMVLVVTGQLVCSYDEEFRRLYARSTVPALLSWERPPAQYQREPVPVQNPNSSHLSLHQIHRPRVMHGMRSVLDERFSSSNMLTRGVSVQDKLHQSHCPEMGNLVRGHSYGGELQKLNSLTRLRMGTKDIGLPDRPAPQLRGNTDLLTNRLSQQHLRHRTRYGADQNLIPFNSETSLHRWKMDAYFENEIPLDPAFDMASPVGSPFSSHTGLNEHQSQLIHTRSREIKSRLEEMRQKRLSLQDYNSLRQSQESLRSMYPTLERPKYMSSLRNLDTRPGTTDFEPYVQNGRNVESVNQKIGEPSNESLYRTVSAAEIDMTMNDPLLKLSHLQSSSLSIQLPRAMESLVEIPEEKDGSNNQINSPGTAALLNGHEEICTDDPRGQRGKSSLATESPGNDEIKGSNGSQGKTEASAGSAAAKERKKSVANDIESTPKILNTSTESQHSVETKASHGEKRREEPSLQRKSSVRMKVQSMLSSDEKKDKPSKKESLQRKASLRSPNTSGSNQPLKADHSQAPAASQKKGHPPAVSRSQNSSGPADAEKPKAAFPRLSPHRSSKRKPNLTTGQDRGSKDTLDQEGATVVQTRREKAYSRYEYLLSTERIPMERDRDMSTWHSKQDSEYPMYQTQNATDKKLGRFMQRVGNLIGKK